MRERVEIINLGKANLFSLALLIFVIALFGVPYILLWGFSDVDFDLMEWGLFFILLILGMIVHEAIHGITWACFAKKGFRSISFGVFWKYLAPYTHCDEPMKIRPYVIAVLMPGIITGVLPAVAGIISGNFISLIIGILMTAGAAGDILVAWRLRKENVHNMVLDHPSECGYIVLEPDDEEESSISKCNFLS
jgi:hypothetical protein